jgi:CHAD domain-containing protein
MNTEGLEQELHRIRVERKSLRNVGETSFSPVARAEDVMRRVGELKKLQKAERVGKA